MAKSTVQESRKDGLRTVFVMQMGQFIDHDLTHAPFHQGECCLDKGKNYPESYNTDKCLPIRIPDSDPFWNGTFKCMEFARSLAAPTLKCNLETRQQVRN